MAKLHGSYESLKGGSTVEAMVEFTGGISEIVNLNKISISDSELFNNLLKAHSKRSLNCCSIQPDKTVHEKQTKMGLIKESRDVNININKSQRICAGSCLLYHQSGQGDVGVWGRGEVDQGQEPLGHRCGVERRLV